MDIDFFIGNITDAAHWGSHISCIPHPVANTNSTLAHWYISAKFKNLKEELTSSQNICIISRDVRTWGNLLLHIMV